MGSAITTDDRIEVLGSETSGEAEPLILKHSGVYWLGLASAHTDRALEAHGVAHSKQICAKVAAPDVWPLGEVADTDFLRLRSWIEEDGVETAYQDGTLSEILPLRDLIEGADLQDGDALLCGTLPAIGGVRPSSRFRMSLSDPVTGRSIEHAYSVEVLPIIA